MSERSPEEIGRRMNGLGLWNALLPFNWAVKPKGVAFPYFCTVVKDAGNPVKVRFLMIEGWQTFHEYIRTRIDINYGFYSSPIELPHFELVVDAGDGVHLFRHGAGYVPRELNEAERPLVARILWEAFGVMMRIETDNDLPLRFAGERSMFARVEAEAGEWSDRPLSIPNPQPHVEKVSYPKSLISKAKDLPLAGDFIVELDFRLLPNIVTCEPRARCAYQLAAIDAKTGERVIWDRVSVVPDGGLRALWEGMPPRVLLRLVERGRIPGEIKVTSGRVFRLLRSLCMELPFKLSLHDSLSALETALKQ